MTKTEVLPNNAALADLAGRINTEHKAVCEAAMTATQHAIKCGVLLTEAKSGLPHGQWLPWLKENCELSERTIQAYMRLARRYEELDGEEAQRVADLPVRQAMVAIADSRADNPLPAQHSNYEEVAAWAEKQIISPINAFDLDSWQCSRNKVRDQLGIPDTVSRLLGLHTKERPMLRLAPYDEVVEALKLMAPVAKGEFGGLDIDHSAASEAYIWAHLIVVSQWDLVLLWDELIYRGKTYKKLPDDEYADLYRSECDEIIGAFQGDCQHRLEEVKRATAEGRYAVI